MPVRKLRPWCYLLLVVLLTVQSHSHAAQPEQALPDVPPGMARAPVAPTGAGQSAVSSPAPGPGRSGDAAAAGTATAAHDAAMNPHDRAIRLLTARGVLTGELSLPADGPGPR
ncbi:MAG: hypothetical protein LOD90_11920, partial [Symbiobacteriaceae bacterium]